MILKFLTPARCPCRYEEVLVSKEPNDGHAGLGQMLAYGWGVPRDRPAAIAHFHAAAEDCRHRRACTGLGQCYLCVQ